MAAGKTSKGGAAKGAKDGGKGGKHPKKSGAKLPAAKFAGKGKQRLHFENAESFLDPADGSESAQWAGSPRRHPTLGAPMRDSIREVWARHALPGGSARREEPAAEGGGSWRKFNIWLPEEFFNRDQQLLVEAVNIYEYAQLEECRALSAERHKIREEEKAAEAARNTSVAGATPSTMVNEEASRKRCAELEGQAAARLAAAAEAENACEAKKRRLEAESSALAREKMMMDDAKNVTYLRSRAIVAVGESPASTGSLMIYTPVWSNQFAAVQKALRESLTVGKKCDAPWSIVSDCRQGLFSRGCVARMFDAAGKQLEQLRQDCRHAEDLD